MTGLFFSPTDVWLAAPYPRLGRVVAYQRMACCNPFTACLLLPLPRYTLPRPRGLRFDAPVADHPARDQWYRARCRRSVDPLDERRLPRKHHEASARYAHQSPAPAGRHRTIEGHNIIALREGTREDTQRLPRILVHELLHCGLYEDRERRGQQHPASLDPREEMVVQAMTDVVLKRLSER